MSQPLVTVLIDTYNYGSYIEDAINSVLGQDFPLDQVEILVVDDGSTDDTAERVKKYGDRVQYLAKQNGGQASAFNFGLERARGGIVAFLDADDYWLPGKLRRVVQEFDKDPRLGMVHHRLKELDVAANEFRDAPFEPVSGDLTSSRERLLLFTPTPTSGVAFRRSVLEQVGPVPEDIRIQADSYIENLALFVAPVAAIAEPLAVYRIHGRNLYFLAKGAKGAETQKRRIETLEALLKGMQGWFKARGCDMRRLEIRTLLRRWMLFLEREEFKVSPPGRLRFVRHLWRAHRNYSPLLTWRHSAVDYANACGSLIVGYAHYHLLEEWRLRIRGALRGGTARPAALQKEKTAGTEV